MGYPNTYIFMDIPCAEPAKMAEFQEKVFGWAVEPKPANVFHRVVPGGEFQASDGSPSGVGNLHLGIYNTATKVPDPRDAPEGLSEPPSGSMPRIYVLVSDDDSEDAILARAEENGAEILWRGWFWREFNGFHASFRDPWGIQWVTWTKPGPDPQVPEGRDSSDLAKAQP